MPGGCSSRLVLTSLVVFACTVLGDTPISAGFSSFRVPVAPRLSLRAVGMDQAVSPMACGAQVRAGSASYRA